MPATSSPTAVGSPSSSAPERTGSVSPRPGAPSPQPGGSGLAGQGRLPLAFMGLGLAWLAAAAAITACAADSLAMPHFAPPVVALTHAWMLGFCVTIAVGAMYQLAPVALGTTVANERSGWRHFALHAISLPAMIHGFWRWQLPLAGAAALAFAAGILVFAINTWRTIRRSGRHDPVAWSLALATGWLVVTVFAGLSLVANRIWNLWPADPIALLRAHAHLGLIGFFATLLQGVTFRLVPMFTLAETPDWRAVRIGLWLSQLGLIVLAPALAWHAGVLAAAAGALVAAGLVTSALALRKTLATRKKRRLDIGVRTLLHGGVVLVLTAVGGAWLAWPTTHASSAPGGFGATVYGVLLIIGGLVPAIAGMMGKIVPFLTWMRAYGPKVGRMPTPPATALSHARLESWALAIQAAAVLPLAAGAWRLDPWLLRIGGDLLALGTAAFIVNMFHILRHLWRPVVAAAPAGKRTP